MSAHAASVSGVRMLLAVALSALSAQAAAAGIDCDLALSEAETAICADPVLRKMDAQLAAALQRARADRAVAEALTADQQRWLDERDACEADVACLRPIYARRIAELTETPGAFRWVGTWNRIGSNGDTGLLRISTRPDGQFRAALDATTRSNAGSVTADAGPGQDRLALAPPVASPRCRIVLRRVGHAIDVEQNEDRCGAGAGVLFSGHYVPGSAERESVYRDLLTLGVVEQPQDDVTLRRLLGTRDYAALVETADEIREGHDADRFGAQVRTLAVRGLDTRQEGVVMEAANGQLWVALLGVDAGKRPQLRYYSTVPAWRDRLPATIAAWRRRFADVPVRMMSATGAAHE